MMEEFLKMNSRCPQFATLDRILFFSLKRNNPSGQGNNMMHLRHYLRYLNNLDTFASSSSSKFVKIVIYVTL
jgi:hypothetical protein